MTYRVIVGSEEHKLNYKEMTLFCFGLRCEEKEFTVIYPSGYKGEFKPM